jgi:hypothetical protein
MSGGLGKVRWQSSVDPIGGEQHRQSRAAAMAVGGHTKSKSEAACARPRVRTLNTANHDGWQLGEANDDDEAWRLLVVAVDGDTSSKVGGATVGGAGSR